MKRNELTARHRLVGAALRRYRESMGYTLGDAARVIAADASVLSRIETGQRPIGPQDLHTLLAEYDATDHARDVLAALAQPYLDGWWSDFRHTLTREHLDFVEAESAATAVLCYAPVQLPDLLLAPGYARAVAAADLFVSEGTEATAVAAVLARQQAALEERGILLTVLLGEAALRRQAGTPGETSAQYRRLVDAASCPNITIRLLPLGMSPTAAGSVGGFTVLQFGPVPNLAMVHVAGPRGGFCPVDLVTAAAYLRVFRCAEVEALSPEETARRLGDLARARLAA
jgi:transcriptional regulator with XRE-family HTH domain